MIDNTVAAAYVRRMREALISHKDYVQEQEDNTPYRKSRKAFRKRLIAYLTALHGDWLIRLSADKRKLDCTYLSTVEREQEFSVLIQSYDLKKCECIDTVEAPLVFSDHVFQRFIQKSKGINIAEIKRYINPLIDLVFYEDNYFDISESGNLKLWTLDGVFYASSKEHTGPEGTAIMYLYIHTFVSKDTFTGNKLRRWGSFDFMENDVFVSDYGLNVR